MSDINLDKASELVTAIRTLDEKYHEERAKLRERLRAALGTDETGRQVRKVSKPKAKAPKAHEREMNVSKAVMASLNQAHASVPQLLSIIGKDHEVAVRSALKKAKARGLVVNMDGIWAIAVPAYKEPEQKKAPEPVKAGGGVSVQDEVRAGMQFGAANAGD